MRAPDLEAFRRHLGTLDPKDITRELCLATSQKDISAFRSSLSSPAYKDTLSPNIISRLQESILARTRKHLEDSVLRDNISLKAQKNRFGFVDLGFFARTFLYEVQPLNQQETLALTLRVCIWRFNSNSVDTNMATLHVDYGSIKCKAEAIYYEEREIGSDAFEAGEVKATLGKVVEDLGWTTEKVDPLVLLKLLVGESVYLKMEEATFWDVDVMTGTDDRDAGRLSLMTILQKGMNVEHYED